MAAGPGTTVKFFLWKGKESNRNQSKERRDEVRDRLLMDWPNCHSDLVLSIV